MKYLKSILIALSVFAFPIITLAAPTSWDFASGILQPLTSQRTAEVKADHFTATSTATSTLPRLESTVADFVNLCIGGDCKNAWPSLGSASWGSIIGTLSAQTDLQNALNAKQDTLVSGTNIKTINGSSVLGSGNLTISGGGSGNVSTSTGETAGNLAYWTSTNGTPALLGKVATSSLTASGLLSLSQPISVIGSASSVLSLPLTKGNFIVGNDAGVAQATSSIFISSLGNVGVNTSTPQATFSVQNRVSTANALLISSAAGVPITTVSNAGVLNAFGAQISGNGGTQGVAISGNGTISSSIGSSLDLRGSRTSTPGVVVTLTNSAGNYSNTSGEMIPTQLLGTFAPTSGSGKLSGFKTDLTVNQTLTANGVVRDILISPTLTKAADYRALEIEGYTYNVAVNYNPANALQQVLLNPFTIASSTAGTIHNASMINIGGVPVGGTNITISSSTGLTIKTGSAGTATNAQGLWVEAPTGATNNYSAIFSGGNLGVATTAPWGQLSVTNVGSNPSLVVEDTASPDSSPFLIDASGNVGIGTTTPSDKLTINGNAFVENQGQLKFGELRTNGNQIATLSASSSMVADVNWTLPNADGSAGQSLTTNGVGNLYWSTPSSAVSWGSITGTLSSQTDLQNALNSKLSSYDAWTHPSAGQSATTSLVILNGNASTTAISSTYSSSTNYVAGNLTIPHIGTAAGTFLAADATGKVIATSTPSGGSSFSMGYASTTSTSYWQVPISLTSGQKLFIQANEQNNASGAQPQYYLYIKPPNNATTTLDVQILGDGNGRSQNISFLGYWLATSTGEYYVSMSGNQTSSGQANIMWTITQ